jgi:hypothetical protein
VPIWVSRGGDVKMIAGSPPLLVICRRQAAYRKSIVFTKLHTAAALFTKENLGEVKDKSFNPVQEF